MASVTVLASDLNQPKHITIAPDGSLVVALSGNGQAPATCINGNQASCVNDSGAIDLVSPAGKVRRLLGGLPSDSVGGPAPEASGPAEAAVVGNKLDVLFQGVDINPQTGVEVMGAAASWLGDLVRFSLHGSGTRVDANFGRFEAAFDPDHGAGTDVTYGQPAIDSDPYSFVPYRGGFAVADAGANDLLFVSRTGKIRVLAVFPTIAESAPAGTFGSGQTTEMTAQAQAVPDSVVVGPDGALYVGELGGLPYGIGKSSVYRVMPGRRPTVYATGFTSITDVAFDRGRLLVLEIDRRGLSDPGLNGQGAPADGALFRVTSEGRATLVASAGLYSPTGLAVARDGAVYVSNLGVVSAHKDGRGGQIVRVNLP